MGEPYRLGMSAVSSTSFTPIGMPCNGPFGAAEAAGDFLAVLEAQRTLYAARDQYGQYKLSRLQAIVSLCKALGGGWQLQEEHVH